MTIEQLDRQQPQMVLIEAPMAFVDQLPLLQGDEVRPPLALYQHQSYYPMAENSPEWQAIRWAAAHQVPVWFIDLDQPDRAPNNSNEVDSNEGDSDEGGNRWSDSRLLGSEYTRQLQQKLGCRSQDEVWQRLFECRDFASADDFFLQVMLYCAASRACHDDESLQQLGDLPREQCMRAHIRDARQQVERIAVLTGGFHTPALFDFSSESAPIPASALDQTDAAAPRQAAVLVRYSDELLHPASGYAAGMPWPAFSRWQLADRLKKKQSDAEEWILFLLKQLGLTLVQRQNVIHHLQQLCVLRQLDRPGSNDLLDSLTSCLVKQQFTADALEPWQQILRGDAIGELPEGLPGLPLVDEVLQQVRASRLKVGPAGQCHFDLLDMNESAAKRRQLLCRLAFVEAGFASPSGGPGSFYSFSASKKRESWSYQWTPSVEVRLAKLGRNGSTLERLIIIQLLNRPQQSLGQSVTLLQQAMQMGLQQHLPQQPLYQQIHDCTDIQTLSQSFMQIFQLSRHPLFADQPLDKLYRALWQQLGFHLAALNQLDMDEALELLVALQGIARQHEDELHQPWQDRLHWLICHNRHRLPMWFALQALEVELTDGDASALLQQVHSQGFSERYAILEALITVVPHWLRQSSGLLELLNHWLEQLDDDHFTEQLPALRKLFSRMDAREIDGITRQLRTLNDWDDPLEWLKKGLSEQDVEQGMVLEQQLQQRLDQLGLNAWLSY
nr:DUF5682 family protein [Oceanobacter mangrovi]